MKLLPLALLPFTILAAESPAPSAAERAIAGAQEQIKKDSSRPDPYNNIAKALVRRARETGDPGFYKQAERALEDSFRIEPGKYEGRKARVRIRIGRPEPTGRAE